jgi:hypothetical protein
MYSVVGRCIALNLLLLAIDAMVLVLYPRNQGFTISSLGGTRFIQGGALLAAVMIIASNVSIAIYILYNLCRLR